MAALVAPVVRCTVADCTERDGRVRTGQYVRVRGLRDCCSRNCLVLRKRDARAVGTTVAAGCRQSVGAFRRDVAVCMAALVAPAVRCAVADCTERDGRVGTGQYVGVWCLGYSCSRNCLVLSQGYACAVGTAVCASSRQSVGAFCCDVAVCMAALVAPVVGCTVADCTERDGRVRTGKHVRVRGLRDAYRRLCLVLGDAYARLVSTAVRARCCQRVGYRRADADVVVVALAAPVVRCAVARCAQRYGRVRTGKHVRVRGLRDAYRRLSLVLGDAYARLVSTAVRTGNRNFVGAGFREAVVGRSADAVAPCIRAAAGCREVDALICTVYLRYASIVRDACIRRLFYGYCS